jgi:transposase
MNNLHHLWICYLAIDTIAVLASVFVLARRVELVDRWFPSSKTCSKCGHIQIMKLSQRIFDCEKCDHIQDRDVNASINLEMAPLDKIRLA